MTTSWAMSSVAIIFFVGGTVASFPNYLCPSLTSRKVFYSCDLDCQQTHGAAYGYCGDARVGDFNCYCGPAQNNIYPQSLHCKSPSANWQRLCEVDCQCNHAGTGGQCLWDKQICGCYGMEQYNGRCPMATIEDFAKFTLAMAGNEAAGRAAQDFLDKNNQNVPAVADEEPY